MKKILMFFLMPIFVIGQDHPIFSEYGEGSSFNKWVEIYNPTSNAINLDNYLYNFCWNGCDNMQWEFSIAFDSSYILQPGQTYLIAHSDAISQIIDVANQTTNILSNGNDVCGLLHINSNTIVDIIGFFDSTSVSDGWDIGSTSNATENHTLIRDPNVCNGNMGDWNISNGSVGISEWIIYESDDINNLNSHLSNCINTNTENINNANTKIFAVYNILGKLSKKEKNSVLFYVYEDGKVEKKILLE